MELLIVILLESMMTYLIIERQDLFNFINFDMTIVISIFIIKMLLYISMFYYKKSKINRILKDEDITEISFAETLKNDKTNKIQRNYYILTILLINTNIAIVEYFELPHSGYFFIKILISYCIFVIPSVLLVVASFKGASKMKISQKQN